MLTENLDMIVSIQLALWFPSEIYEYAFLFQGAGEALWTQACGSQDSSLSLQMSQDSVLKVAVSVLDPNSCYRYCFTFLRRRSRGLGLELQSLGLEQLSLDKMSVPNTYRCLCNFVDIILSSKLITNTVQYLFLNVWHISTFSNSNIIQFFKKAITSFQVFINWQAILSISYRCLANNKKR